MPLTFHLLPHTHWDREWFLTRATYQARLVPVLDEVLTQLERDVNARFLLDGQTILLEDYLAVRPENEARIAALVQRGALEIGPWYVLSDMLIPAAASLRRNLTEGIRDAAHFGKHLDVFYSPDAFGHPAWLPQLAAEFGIRRAVIRRGLGLPLDFYRWEAPTGESVLVHHLRKGGYDIAVDLAEAGMRLADVWKPIRAKLLEHTVTDEIAVFLGADHHAMVRDVSSLCANLQALEPDSRVRVSGLKEFFDAVEQSDVAVPIVRGELRRGGDHTWVLQGVHSARSRMKRHHGTAERALSHLSGVPLREADEGLLQLAWRTLLQCQFHDTLAGTSSDEVQREQTVRLNTVESIAQELLLSALHRTIGHDPDFAREYAEQVTPTLVLQNCSSASAAGIVTAELTFFVEDVLVGPPTGRTARRGAGYQPFALNTPTNEVIAVQVIRVWNDEERIDARRHYPDLDRVARALVAFQAPLLNGGETLRLFPVLSELTPSDDRLEVAEGMLANRLVSLKISRVGAVTLTDRITGEIYSDLLGMVADGDRGDLYTFSNDPAADAGEPKPRSQTIIAGGPLAGVIETRWILRFVDRGEIGLRLTTTLFADSPIVRFALEISNQASYTRLRAAFPIGCSGTVAGASSGVERRSAVVRPETIDGIEREVATGPAHRFVASAIGARGLVIMQTGFFEYEETANGTVLITLLRSVGELSRGNLPERPGHAAWPVSTPGGQEYGSHMVELAVAPVGETTLASPDELERIAVEAAGSVRAVFVRDFVGGISG